MSFTKYITLDPTIPSRSGLYAVDLPGISLTLLAELTDDEQEDYLALWDKIYLRSVEQLIADVTIKMQEVFYVDQKLSTRESSEYKEVFNDASGLAGVKIRFALPKYAKLHIISLGVFSESNYTSPEGVIQIFEKDENGELLKTIVAEIESGRNTINVDSDFECDELFIAYDPSTYSFRKTDNKYFNSKLFPYDAISCEFPCAGSAYTGYVRQYNGGGINIKFVVQCSIKKFIEENINLFRHALWQSVGVQTTIERVMTDTFSRFTTMTEEEAEKRMTYFKTEYEKNIKSVIEGIRIPEDDVCFCCKSPATVATMLP